MTWKDLFETRILQRGRDYYRQGLVTDLWQECNTLHAVVQGSEDYEVAVTLKDHVPVFMDCTCPHAESGSACKHMAAVLFAYNETADKSEPASPPKPSPEKLIADADEEALRSFLLQAVMRDKALLAGLELYLSRHTEDIDLAAYRRSIQATIRKYQDRHGYIDYDHADDFIEAIEQYLYEDIADMTEKGYIAEAFSLCCDLFKAVADVDIDDDGGLSVFGSDAVEAWCKIIRLADEKQKADMFIWFMSHLDGWVMDYMESYVEQVLFDSFKEPEYLHRKMKYLDSLILSSATNSYNYGVLILRRIRLMEQMQVPEQELLDYCSQYAEISDVRDYLIDYQIAHNRNDAAILLLKYAIETAHPYSPVKQYREKLLRLYQKQNRNDEYLEELHRLAADYGDLECYRELKAYYGTDEWPTVREKLFADTTQYYLPEFYAEDKLYSRLMEYVSHEATISVLRKYEYLLVEQYPEQILRIYTDSLINAAQRSADRKCYREWAYCLKHMATIEGGTEIAQALATKWKSEYKNRPAMMEELRKAGF